MIMMMALSLHDSLTAHIKQLKKLGFSTIFTLFYECKFSGIFPTSEI